MARNLAPERQAARAIRSLTAFGQPRHNQRDDGKVHSVGTARSYEQTFRTAATHLLERHDVSLYHGTPEQVREYLDARSTEIGQTQLNGERRALELYYREARGDATFSLPHTRSEVEQVQTARAYTDAQVALLTERMSARMSLSTRVADAAGLRASELYTLQRIEERAPSSHRTWSSERFVGREDWSRYTVDGKGGLVREVRLPAALARELESTRLAEPKPIRDREVRLETRYDVAGGRNFSNAFSRDAQRHLGWSEGAHGLRHSYAQRRMDELGDQGKSYPEALGVVSQELGHFRPEITEVYLR